MAGISGRCRLQVLLSRCSCSSNGTVSKGLKRPLILRGGSRMMSSGRETEATKAAAVRQQLEAAAREDRLDFFAAAKILFSTPSKPRKFGLDFHLWQFFVACLPPFAVYLTAQYSRSEMRRLEKERDQREQLKLEAALAEKLAAQSADEGSQSPQLSSPLKSGNESSAMHQETNAESKSKNKEETVVILAEDFLAMKERLDAMEEKVNLLESVCPGATFIIPLGSEPNLSKGSEEENMQQTSVRTANNADAEEDQQRKVEKQKNSSQLAEQNQKPLQVTERRFWFPTRSKREETELSE